MMNNVLNQNQINANPFFHEKKNHPCDLCLECHSSGKKCGDCTKKENLHSPKKEETKSFDEKENKSQSDGFLSTIKKTRKYKSNYICTAHCRYDIVRQIASKFGMRESQENWNVLWSDYLVTCEKVKNLRKYQKINHFPGMAEICRKDFLARNLNRMIKLFPKDYDFYPKTWLLPIDLGEVTDYGKKHKSTTYILKPDMGCKGKGILLTKNVKDLVNLDRTICQVYVPRPYLIDGFKFDLRVYVLITSCDPLRLYVYNEGLVRFATKRYNEPNKTNMSNMYMHLTNYSVNKFSRTYIADPEEGSKRKLSTLNDYLKRQFHDVTKLWENIDDVIIKTVLLALPTLQHNYKAAFPGHHRNRQACFELLGFDLILDNSLKPFLLEVNHSPSFHTDAPIDREVKEALIIDTFKILNLPKNIKLSVMLEEKQNVTNRLLKDFQNSPNCSQTNAGVVAVTSEENLKTQELFEKEHKGNFRKIYPNNSSHQYSVFYCQGTSSLFNETFSSRARERVSKLMKEGIQESDLAKLKPFESVLTQLTKRPSPLREEFSLNSDLPSLMLERSETNEQSTSTNLYREQNGDYLKKVQEYGKSSKMENTLKQIKLKWKKQGDKERAMPRPNKNIGYFKINSDSDQIRDPKEFHWDINFGISKNQYKIDSFPGSNNSSRNSTPRKQGRNKI